jgi:hypothetical protein
MFDEDIAKEDFYIQINSNINVIIENLGAFAVS